MSTQVTGSFLPSLVYTKTNPVWSTLSASFTSPTNFTLDVVTLPPNTLVMPEDGDSFTTTVSIFTGKGMSACQKGGVCWQLVTSSIEYIVGGDTYVGTLAAGSSFNGIAITGTIMITRLTFDLFAFSISGTLASPIQPMVPAVAGQNLVTVEVGIATSGQSTPTTWNTAYKSTTLLSQLILGTPQTSPSILGGIQIIPNLDFTIIYTPPRL